MEEEAEGLRQRLTELLNGWRKNGLASREGFLETAELVFKWREKKGLPGLWENPPLFVTATVDDAWGHGLQIIEAWAGALGMDVHRVGLLKRPGEIIASCRRLNPDFLGMTVLQFDSEDDIAEITGKLPRKTLLIAGGPLFAADPELAERAGIHVVAKNAADFIAFMLKFGADCPECG